MLYKRADADEYGQWVAVAGVTTFDTLRTQHLPRAEAAPRRQFFALPPTDCWGIAHHLFLSAAYVPQAGAVPSVRLASHHWPAVLPWKFCTDW